MEQSAGQRPTPPPDSASAAFTRAIPALAGLKALADERAFVPLPADWWVGVADVAGSTEAIAAGRYKRVNTAGAAVVSAVSNALGTLDFPFLFAGDGAAFAVAPAEAARAGTALAATVAWAATELGLHLRGATLPVAAIRAAGHDVRVARHAASPDAAYAMFAGGGLAWAEARLKQGLLTPPDAPPGARPDLTGLSCRFRDVAARQGLILSVLVKPLAAGREPAFAALLDDVLRLADDSGEAARPVPRFAVLGGIDLGAAGRNARIHRAAGRSRLGSGWKALREMATAAALLTLRAEIGRFSARRYLREVADNADLRKYGDGLMMTLDCTPALAGRLEARLAAAWATGVAAYGLHRQSAATITCVVPSVTDPHHVHFIDGAAGGYAMAAGDLKSRLASVGKS